MVNKTLLSIIFTSCTMDRVADIYKLLDSIRAQTYPHIETIFVGEHSQELFEKVKSYTSADDNFKLIVAFNSGEPGLSAARNLGINESAGHILAFVDDDVILFPDWAEQLVKAFEDRSVIGITGPAFPLWEEESMSWFPEELY